MNTLLLLLGLRPWHATNSTAALTRLMVAVGLLSIEMQAITLANAGTLHSLVPFNAVVALGLFRLWRPGPPPPGMHPVRPLRALPVAGTLLVAAVVLILGLTRPFEAADPYHLEKVERIARTGDLRYDAATETKINILNSTYELLLADLQAVPGAGPWLLRLHGALGLVLLLAAVGAVREHLCARDGGLAHRTPPDGGPLHTLTTAWPAWSMVLVVPVLFHQLVLAKNDLFVGALALVVLTWAITHGATAPARDLIWASWLGGFAVAVKLTALPLLVVLGGLLAWQRRDRWTALTATALGVTAGLLAGGLLFTLFENLRVYGALMPVQELGNRPRGATEVVLDVGRFALSLFDLGQLTRRWWPGRGGWGGTFGLPMVWALLVLVPAIRRQVPQHRDLRLALLCAGGYFLCFSAAFPDADIAQRLALGPGLLLVALAAHEQQRSGFTTTFQRVVFAACLLLSSMQIGRSAWLYLP